MSSRWPNPDPGARGLRNQGQRASTYRNPEGGRGTRHWGSAHWGPFLFTEHASQALPWSGDRSQLGCTGWDAGSPVSRALGPASPGLGPALFAGSLGITHQNTTSAGGANLWSFAPAAASSTRWDCSIGCNLATSWGGPGAQQGVPRGAPRPQPPHLAVARAHANRPGKRGVPSGGRRVELGPICLSLLRSFHVSEVFETGLSKRVSAPRY